jgi:hypothetical protein
MIDVLSAPYGGRRPVNDLELDLAAFTAARAAWDGHNGFNGVFDKPSTVWEAMSTTLQTVAAVPLPMGSRISLAHDGVKPTRMAVFTDDNIVDGSLTIQYQFERAGDPQGVRIEYREPWSYDPEFVSMPPDREDALNVNLFGCTDEATAQQHAMLQLAKMRYQRKTAQFTTELDGLMVRHGDRIAIAHSLPSWGQHARVESFGATTLRFDRDVTWAASTVLLMRDPFGAVHQVAATRGADDRTAVLAALPFTPVALGQSEEATLVAIGDSVTMATDWIVTSMEPRGEYQVDVTAVAYDERVYDDAMPHQRTPI